jgi:hypothetical protein
MKTVSTVSRPTPNPLRPLPSKQLTKEHSLTFGTFQAHQTTMPALMHKHLQARLQSKSEFLDLQAHHRSHLRPVMTEMISFFLGTTPRELQQHRLNKTTPAQPILSERLVI